MFNEYSGLTAIAWAQLDEGEGVAVDEFGDITFMVANDFKFTCGRKISFKFRYFFEDLASGIIKNQPWRQRFVVEAKSFVNRAGKFFVSGYWPLFFF